MIKNLLTYLAQLTSPILNVLRFLNHTVDILKGGDTLLTALRVHTYIHTLCSGLISLKVGRYQRYPFATILQSWNTSSASFKSIYFAFFESVTDLISEVTSGAPSTNSSSHICSIILFLSRLSSIVST